MNEKGKPSFGFLFIVTALFKKEQEIKILHWYLLQARFGAMSEDGLLVWQQSGEADDKLASGSPCHQPALCHFGALFSSQPTGLYRSVRWGCQTNLGSCFPQPWDVTQPFSTPPPPNGGLGRGQRVTSAWERGRGSEEALLLSSLWQKRPSGTQDWGSQVLWGWGWWKALLCLQGNLSLSTPLVADGFLTSRSPLRGDHLCQSCFPH